MHHLVICYNGAARLPLLLAFEKDFSNWDGASGTPICTSPRNCLKNNSLGLIGLQGSGCKGAGLKPGVVEALEVEVRAEEHEVVVVVIFVVAHKDVELMLGKELMGGCVLPMLLELAA